MSLSKLDSIRNGTNKRIKRAADPQIANRMKKPLKHLGVGSKRSLTLLENLLIIFIIIDIYNQY